MSITIDSPAGPAPAAHARSRAAARARAMPRNSTGPMWLKVRHTVASDPTDPNMSGWARSAARSLRHVAPSASANTIWASVRPASWRRCGTAAIAALNPAVEARQIGGLREPRHPACDTSPAPSPVTRRGRISLLL